MKQYVFWVAMGISLFVCAMEGGKDEEIEMGDSTMQSLYTQLEQYKNESVESQRKRTREQTYSYPLQWDILKQFYVPIFERPTDQNTIGKLVGFLKYTSFDYDEWKGNATIWMEESKLYDFGESVRIGEFWWDRRAFYSFKLKLKESDELKQFLVDYSVFYDSVRYFQAGTSIQMLPLLETISQKRESFEAGSNPLDYTAEEKQLIAKEFPGSLQWAAHEYTKKKKRSLWRKLCFCKCRDEYTFNE